MELQRIRPDDVMFELRLTGEGHARNIDEAVLEPSAPIRVRKAAQPIQK